MNLWNRPGRCYLAISPNSQISPSALRNRMGQTLRDFLRPHFGPILMIVLVLSPIICTYVILNELPVGGAGLYTLMAQSVDFRDLAHPGQIPYYGPAPPIPFAYPPLALWVMALSGDMGITSFDFVRVVPAVYVMLVALSVYVLAMNCTKSVVKSTTCCLFVLLSPVFLAGLLESGGVVRALASASMITGLAVSYRATATGKANWAVLGGVLLGLTVWIHLYYATAYVIGIAVFAIFFRGAPHRLRTTACISGIGAALALPWAIIVIANYGMDTMLLVIPTHLGVFGTWIAHLLHLPAGFAQDVVVPASTSGSLADRGLTGLIGKAYGHIPALDIMVRVIPIAAAMAWLIGRRRFLLPIWSVALLPLGSSGYPLVILVSGLAVAEAAGAAWSALRLTRRKRLYLGLAAASTVLAGVYLCAATTKWVVDTHGASSLRQADVGLGLWFREHTGPTESFAVVDATANDSVEWLPYLFQRVMVGSPWGGEWTGTYASEGRLLRAINGCGAQQSLQCFDALMAANDRAPMYLVIHEESLGGKLSDQLEATSEWTLAIEMDGASVWKRTSNN